MCYTYILRMSNNKHYTGIAKDLKKRFDQHQAGHSISTRRYLPVRMIWSHLSKSRKEARILEVKIKSRGAKRFLLDQTYKIIESIGAVPA